jgi:DNA invertase Pin-like site-specific DNA recombinase
VSTSTADQLNSLDNQVSFFKNFILKNRNWKLVDYYIDEGISGTSVKKRESFLKMTDDSKYGKFDLILTKEISRFARNTMDSISYTQKLLLNNVGVYFLNDNINTFEPDSELRLTIMSSIVQEEVRKISGRVKFGYKEAIKNGRVLGNDKIWGYIKNDGKLVICEQEAEVVRTIFNLYISGYGINTICNKLYQMGYKNQNGNKFTYNTIRHIISNPKYKGYYAGQKTEKIDYRYNKRINFNKDQWVIYQASNDVVPAIIDKKVWDAANLILTKRSERYSDESSGRSNGKSVYSGKLICKQHNTSYWRSLYKYKNCKKEIWQCKIYRNQGIKSCNNPHLYTVILDKMITLLIKKLFLKDNEVIDALMEIYKNSFGDEQHIKDLKDTEIKINKIKQRKDKLLDLFMENSIDKHEFNTRTMK